VIFSEQELLARAISRGLCDISEYVDHFYDPAIDGTFEEVEDDLEALAIELRGLLKKIEEYRELYVC